MRSLVLLMALAACGPVNYVSAVTNGASSSVDAARAVDAEKYAPYYYTRAVQYLRMSREQAARADFQGAVKFGKLAHEAGDKAAEEAELAKKDSSRMPLDAATVPNKPAPAKDPAPVPAKAKDSDDDAPPVPAKDAK
jgi:sRNA-binding protein